jgi:hypothetical protein
MSARRFSDQADIVMARILWLFFAEADGLDLVFLDAEQAQ